MGGEMAIGGEGPLAAVDPADGGGVEAGEVVEV